MKRVISAFPNVIRAEREGPAIGADRRSARSGGLEGEWDRTLRRLSVGRRKLGESALPPGVRNLPLRTTGSVPRNEQCVCHWGSESRASRRPKYKLGCRAEGREISRETIMKRRAPV